jgi:hypothetical protein
LQPLEIAGDILSVNFKFLFHNTNITGQAPPLTFHAILS